MKRHTAKKLILSRQTVRTLTTAQLEDAAGGLPSASCKACTTMCGPPVPSDSWALVYCCL